jgi:hypothetical protein
MVSPEFTTLSRHLGRLLHFSRDRQVVLELTSPITVQPHYLS